MKRTRVEADTSSNTDAKLAAFREKMSDRSMDLYRTQFVDKVEHLTKIFESELFNKEVHTIHNAKKSKVDGEFLCNAVLAEMIDVVKVELAEFVEGASTIKVWIQLLTPAIADGNNFGVSVQEEVVQEFGRAEENAFNALDTISKYFLQRAKLISKHMKYPLLDDYSRCIREVDEKVYITLRLSMMDLRNNYLVLRDMLHKNFTKVVAPRGANDSVSAMY